MPLPAAARDYLLHGLAATPAVIGALVDPASQTGWERRTDPERFSLREALAHLADWEPIWLERAQRIAAEEHPFLPSIDEGRIAAERDYASSDPGESLRRFREGRARLLDSLQPLPLEAWDRTGNREFVGVLSLQQLIGMALGHDGYHLAQIVELTAGP